LVVINFTQWSGDYLTTGIDTITMDVNNLGATDLSLRLFVADPPAGPSHIPTHTAISTDFVSVPAGSGWTRVVFPVDPASLTALRGSVEGALADVAELRILHNPNPTFPPPTIDAQLGVDNIELPGTPFRVTQATYVRDGTGTTTVFGFASVPQPFVKGTTISMSAGGSPASMKRSGLSFFGSLPVPAPPATLAVTATEAGANPTTLSKGVTDMVFISRADYSLSGKTIDITAASSDQSPTTPVVLTVKGGGMFQPQSYGGGQLTISNVRVPPRTIQVTSSLGGTDVAPVNFVP
jgi:hypothetical protein